MSYSILHKNLLSGKAAPPEAQNCRAVNLEPDMYPALERSGTKMSGCLFGCVQLSFVELQNMIQASKLVRLRIFRPTFQQAIIDKFAEIDA